MQRNHRAWLFAAWVGVVAVLGWVVDRNLVVGADLRLFMPSPTTQVERLILDEIGEGPASRMLLLAIDGGSPEAAAATSRALAAELTDRARFRWVANGENNLGAVPDSLLAYRYLLAPTRDHTRFDAGYLTAQLHERLRDMSSPAAGLLEPWLPRDPTLELLNLAETWQPARQPQLLHDVWFDRSGKQALLVVETVAAGFDPNAQRDAADVLQKAFDKARVDPALKLTVSGPGAFSVLMQERTQNEAQWLGSLATLGMIVLLLVAYRRVSLIVLGALPLASAGLAGLAAVSAVSGTVHGITLAFGFTLIGVAQDYPMHLFSHQHRGVDPRANARSLWPTLATGVASTCIAYLAFLFSGVRGLAQLSIFTVVGLAVAGLTTRFLLPPLIPSDTRDAADVHALGRLWAWIAGLPRPLWLGVAVAVGSVMILTLSPRPLWQDQLGGLTPVPRALIERDAALRSELGAPDLRHLLVIDGPDAQAVLERSSVVAGQLDRLVAAGGLAGFDHPARYLPPVAVQERRRAMLPASSELRSALATAVANTPFRPEIFEPFLADVDRARQMAPLQPQDLASTPLESRVGGLLRQHDGRWTGLVTLSGLTDLAGLRQIAAADPGVTMLDLKQASEDLVAHQRTRILWCLAVSAALLVMVVLFALRSVTRARRVLAPMALTTLLVAALLHVAGVSLNLFHLIALVLAAGLGLDYALFFEHVSDDPAEQRRTLHAVIVCSLSTLMVFALLATSSLPVLRSIGVTVSAGVVCNFVLALMLIRPRVAR